MMNSQFLKRLRKEFEFQWGIFRSVVDWTIFAYLFIPALVIFGYNYFLWWSVDLNWLNGIHLPLFLGFLYVLCWQGRLRTFLEAADQLFLVQHHSLVISLKKQTRNYYLFGYSVGIVIILLILAPFMIRYFTLTWIEIFLLCFYFCSLKVLILVGKQYLDDIQSAWLKNLFIILAFLAGGTLSFALIPWALKTYGYLLLVMGSLYLFVALFYSSKRVRQVSTFLKDVYVDKNQKLKYVKMIFLFSEYVEKVPEQPKKTSFFYKNSKRIYKNRNRQKALQELFIKVFFRNKGFLLQYLQIIGVTVSALIVIPPVWIKSLLFLGFIILLRMWLKVVTKRIMSNHYIVTVKKDDLVRFKTERYVVNAFSIPVICILGIVLILLF